MIQTIERHQKEIKRVLKECQELVLTPKHRHKIKRERKKRKEEDCMNIIILQGQTVCKVCALAGLKSKNE